MKPVNTTFTVELLKNKVYKIYTPGDGHRHIGIPSITYVNVLGLDVPNLDECYNPETKQFEYKTKIGDHLPDIRDMRNLRIQKQSWAVERHIHEREMNKETSLTSDQYQELLEYIQALRDFPDTLDFEAPWQGSAVLSWPELSITLGQKLQK